MLWHRAAACLAFGSSLLDGVPEPPCQSPPSRAMAESPAAPHARPHAAGSGLFSRGRSGRRVAASLRFEFSLPCWLTRFRTFPGVTGHRDGAFSDEALKNRAVDLSSSRSVEASRCRQPPGDVTPGNRLSGGCLASSSFLRLVSGSRTVALALPRGPLLCRVEACCSSDLSFTRAGRERASRVKRGVFAGNLGV